MRIFSVGVTSLLLLATSAAAQTADTAAPETATPDAQVETTTDAPADATQTPAETSAESPAEAAGPQVGETYVRETINDWTIRCLRAPVGQTDPCQMFQILREEAGNPAAEVSVTRLQQAEGEFIAKMDIFMPLETFLPPGVSLAVDGREAGRVPIQLCNPRRCLTEVPLKDSDVSVFKRGNEAVVSIVAAAAPDTRIPLEMSLSGFTAAFESLSN